MGIALVYLLLKFIILPLTVRSRDYKFISSYSVQINIMRPQVKTVSMCCLTTAHPHSPQHFHRLFMGLVTICISLLTYDWSVPNGVKVSWGQICLPCCFLVTTKNIFHLCPGKEKNVFERKKKNLPRTTNPLPDHNCTNSNIRICMWKMTISENFEVEL